jgi:hypothetical protein
VHARGDALSGEIFRSKLVAMQQLREQIEGLTAKHRMEEEALSFVLSSIKFEDQDQEEAARRKSQEELVAAVLDRDRAIEMLETVRREANAIITRMHDNLKRGAEQNEQAVRRIEELSRENASLRETVGKLQKSAAAGRASTGTVVDSPSKESSQAGEVSADHLTADMVADYEQRSQEYVGLLADAEDVIRQHRDQILVLQQQLAAAQQGHHQPQSPTANADAHATDDGARRMIEELRDQLRAERRQRLQSEEQGQHILVEQQRHIDLLEQRLAQSQRASTSNAANTPRSARSAVGPYRRSSVGGTPTNSAARAPPAAVAVDREIGDRAYSDNSTPNESTTTGIGGASQRRESTDANAGVPAPEATARAGDVTTPVGNAPTATPSPAIVPASTRSEPENVDGGDSSLAAAVGNATGDAADKDTIDGSGEDDFEDSDEEHAESMNRIHDLQKQLDTIQQSMTTAQ